MADYGKGMAFPGAAPLGNSAFGVRNDTPSDLSGGTNATLEPIQMDSAGGLRVSTEGGKATYSCSIIGLVPVSAATDLVVLTGSATKTIKLTRCEIAITATAAAGVDLQLVKRSTADTGGTSTAPAITPHDANNPAATGVVAAYTANPASLGTLVGSAIRATKLNVTTTTTVPDSVAYEFGARAGAQQPVIRGIAQQLAINLNGGTVGAGGSADVVLEWVEEPTTA